MPWRLQGVFQGTRLKLPRMFNEECRRGGNHNSHNGIRSDLSGAAERTNLWNVGTPLLVRRGGRDSGRRARARASPVGRSHQEKWSLTPKYGFWAAATLLTRRGLPDLAFENSGPVAR